MPVEVETEDSRRYRSVFAVSSMKDVNAIWSVPNMDADFQQFLRYQSIFTRMPFNNININDVWTADTIDGNVRKALNLPERWRLMDNYGVDFVLPKGRVVDWNAPRPIAGDTHKHLRR